MSDHIRPRRWFPRPPIAAESARRLIDAALAIALAGLTFLLGCQELFDADVWWHLRAGRWIVDNRAISRVDPFTFGSAGLPSFLAVLPRARRRGLALAARAGPGSLGEHARPLRAGPLAPYAVPARPGRHARRGPSPATAPAAGAGYRRALALALDPSLAD